MIYHLDLARKISHETKFGTKKVAPKNAVYAEFTRLSVVFPVISAQKSACADEITIPSINATQNDMMCACACGCGSSGQRGSGPSACRAVRSGDPDLSVNMGALVNSLLLLRRLIVIAK